MKKRILGMMALVLAGMLTLTACSSSDTDASDKATGTGSAGTAQNASGIQEVNGTTVDGAVSNHTGSSSEQTGADSTASGTTDGLPGTDGDSSGNGSGTSGDTGSEDDREDSEDPGEEGTASQDIWSGAYIGAEETVTIAKLDEESISFSFAQAGISGTARVQGSQAVYNGDDHYVVVFNIQDTVLDISVSSEEDYDASDSPLIGTYVREAS